MELSEVLDTAIAPAMDILGFPITPKVRVLLFAIGLQESRFEHRRQLGNGPAMGFWQFERGGGERGVLNHDASKKKALELCDARGVVPDPASVWAALEHDDVLAAGFARLLLLTDAEPLPEVTDTEGAWNYYTRCWRPGKPHRDTWDDLHARARVAGA